MTRRERRDVFRQVEFVPETTEIWSTTWPATAGIDRWPVIVDSGRPIAGSGRDRQFLRRQQRGCRACASNPSELGVAFISPETTTSPRWIFPPSWVNPNSREL